MKRFSFLRPVRLPLVAAGAMLLVPAALSAQDLTPQDPIGEIAFDMQEVVIDLSGLNTGDSTQQAQKQVVGKLDKLIEELEKECAACRGGASGANPNRPLADSMIIGGPGGIGDLHAPPKDGKKWGELPPRQRDKIVQSLTEGFPPHYQRILERYYRRLAEETPATAVEGEETGGGDAAREQDNNAKPQDDAAAAGAVDQPVAKPKPKAKATSHSSPKARNSQRAAAAPKSRSRS